MNTLNSLIISNMVQKEAEIQNLQIQTISKERDIEKLNNAQRVKMALFERKQTLKLLTINKVVEFFDSGRESINPYNNPSMLKGSKIIEEGFSYPFELLGGLKFRASYLRKEIMPNQELINKYMGIISFSGFYHRSPILLDKQMRVIDGLQRIKACEKINHPFYWFRFDIDGSLEDPSCFI